ncbi:uncharacterized protein LOC130700747 [Daphnia carinata]|uniref:uncharacterized protein LOC130700747 n=1 Tax=Daphnia carinata TaxID=120202 RepID=UPI002580D707|nr:uncharacterized protein LOC130700747 [Daphnia carinata]
MKIALFVLSCLIAVSRQQNGLWSQYHQQTPFQYHYASPATHNLRQWANVYPGSYPYYATQYSQPQYVKYFPFMAKQNPGVVLFKSFPQSRRDDENDEPLVRHNNEEESIEARIASPKGGVQEGRLFDNALLSNLLFGSVATSTKYSIATTTIISTSVISCIPSASFSSTTACRRRRDVSAMMELLKEHEALSPSTVERVEPSAVLQLESLSDVNNAKAAQDSVTIVSSLDDGNNSRAAGARFIGLNALLTLTTTSTLTTATISVTESRKTVTLGSSLLCLPSGIKLC